LNGDDRLAGSDVALKQPVIGFELSYRRLFRQALASARSSVEGKMERTALRTRSLTSMTVPFGDCSRP